MGAAGGMGLSQSGLGTGGMYPTGPSTPKPQAGPPGAMRPPSLAAAFQPTSAPPTPAQPMMGMQSGMGGIGGAGGAYGPPGAAQQPISSQAGALGGGGVAPPPISAGPSTHPAGGAAGVSASGLPVSWPVPTTTQQLGSTTSTTAHLNRSLHATATSQPQSTPMAPGQLDQVKYVLGGLLQHEGNSKKKMDVQKKLEELYQKLSTGSISQPAQDKVVSLTRAIESHDYATANKVHLELSNSEWEHNRNWLMGVKRLLPRG